MNSGQPKRTTNQPTTLRLLKAVAHQEVTLTQVVVGHQVQWHLTLSLCVYNGWDVRHEVA